MNQPRTPEREKEFQKFVNGLKGNGIGFLKNALEWFKQNIGSIVTSRELARIPGKEGFPISHNLRRIFELRDEQGYQIANHKDNSKTGLGLKIDEWVLLNLSPDPSMIRTRGVNKRIMFEVFERDKFTCKSCGRTPEDDDPFKPDHKVKLHVGHLKAHKQEDGSISNVGKDLTKEDFVTLCNVCNEGQKNKDFKKVTLLDRVNLANQTEQKEIYLALKKKFN
ncbi:MAG: HNH endonuclease [Candidatus Pacearchaeota archaeon]